MIDLQVMDNIRIQNVNVKYWFGTGVHMNESMSFGLENERHLPITIPQSLDSLYYTVFAIDTSGNLNITEPKELTVIDNDKPNALAGDDLTREAYNNIEFNGNASTDNIGIKNYTWHILYNSEDIYLYGDRVNFIFEISGNYPITLTVVDFAGLTHSNIIHVNIDPLPDNDKDGNPDPFDDDDDNDEILDIDEIINGTDQFLNDTDEDGYNDLEDHYPLDPEKWDKQNPKKDKMNLGSIGLWLTVIIIIISFILSLFLFLIRNVRVNKNNRERIKDQEQLLDASNSVDQKTTMQHPQPSPAPTTTKPTPQDGVTQAPLAIPIIPEQLEREGTTREPAPMARAVK